MKYLSCTLNKVVFKANVMGSSPISTIVFFKLRKCNFVISITYQKD